MRYSGTQCILSFILLTFALIQQTQASQLYQKIIHHTDDDAKCLDGSPAGIYVHSGKQKKKFLIFLQGGGYCGQLTVSQTLQSCYKRSKTILGSSTLWPDTIKGQGYLSTDPTKNIYAEWTKAIIIYCDGALHQGYAKQPIKYKNTDLYFRGQNLTRSQFAYLNSTFGLYSAQNIVLTGGSAGAIGAYLWNNYLISKVDKPDNVISIFDSGVLLDYPTYHTKKHEFRTKLQNLYKLSNKDAMTPLEQCNILYVENYKCLLFQHNYLVLKGWNMVINSQYDSWAIPNILGIKCLKVGASGISETLADCSKSERQYIQSYRKRYLQIMSGFTILLKKSLWTMACSNHVYACIDLKVPVNTGYTAKTAVEHFIQYSEKVMQIDAAPWPANVNCAY